MGPPGAQRAFGRRLPDVPHRAARRACPADPLAPMKEVNIKDLWYNQSGQAIGTFAGPVKIARAGR